MPITNSLNMATAPDHFVLTGRYADRYRWENLPATRGEPDPRPTAQDIIDEEELRNKMSDKVFLVTGCSSGAGVAIVTALASTGATVFATARNLAKARAALGSAMAASEEGRIRLLHVDQADFASVRRCAAEFRQAAPGGKLHVLVCNAGIMAPPHTLVAAGGGIQIESQLATNYVSHFLLFELLKDMLLASSTAQFRARVVAVSSSAHKFGTVDLDDINYTEVGREYDPFAAYVQSKVACIWWVNQIERLYGARGLHANSLMPGGWGSGNPDDDKKKEDTRDAAEEEEKYKDPKVAKMLCTVEQGAASSVWAAVSKDLEGLGGRYLEGACFSGPVPEDAHPVDYGYAKWAFDEDAEQKLYKLTREMLGLEESS